MSEKHGVKAGAEIAEFEVANLEAAGEYIRANGVDCDFTMTQAVDVQLTEDHNTALKSRYDRFIAAGASIAKSAFYLDGKDAEMVSSLPQARRHP